MSFKQIGLSGLSAVLATFAVQAQNLHQQSSNFFAAGGGIIKDATGVTRDSGTAPANFEFMTIHHGYEHVGFADGGITAPTSFSVDGVQVIIQDQDGGTVGTGMENTFNIAVYGEDPAAPPAAGSSDVNPDLATRQVVGPFAAANTGTVGTPQAIIYDVIFPTAVTVSRLGSGPGGAGTLFTGVEFNVETPPNFLTIWFATTEDLFAATGGQLIEYDLPNGSSDSFSTVNAGGHGLNATTTCGGGYAYVDNRTTAALDFFDTTDYFIAPLNAQASFKVQVETQQMDTIGGGTGNQPLSNTPPGSTTLYSSRRPVNNAIGDCFGNLRQDNLWFRYENTNIPANSLVAIFASFGVPTTPASLTFLPGWTGMICFGNSGITLTVDQGVTDPGMTGDGTFISNISLAADPGLAGGTITFTGIAVDTSNVSIHAGSCERVLF